MTSTTKLGHVAERAPLPVIGIDRDGVLTYVNESTCGLLGRARDEIVGRRFWDFLDGPQRQSLKKSFLKDRERGIYRRYETTIETTAGDAIIISWHNVPFYGNDGRLEEVFSVGADITKLRRTEARLERLNAILDALSRISRIALRAEDSRNFLDQAAAMLVDSGACIEAWITLVGDDGLPIGLVGSGELATTTGRGKMPHCVSTTLENPPQLLSDLHERCDQCPFAPADDARGISTIISHNGRIYAVLGVHVGDLSAPLQAHEQLLRTIADDLGFTLAMLEARAIHQRTESALAEHTRLLDSLFESSLEPTAIFDRDFNFLRVNNAYASSCNYERDELIGRDHFELFPNAENQHIFERVRDTGEPYEVSARPFEYPADPERGMTWWDWTLVPIHGADGEVELLGLWLRDVTEEQRAKRELEAQRNFIDAVVEEAGGIVVVVDANARIMRFNQTAERISGRSAEDVIGQDLIETLLPEEDRRQAREDFLSDHGNSTRFYESRWERPDGSLRRIFWSISTVTGRAGIDFVVGTGWDVTQEREMAAALEESEQKYRELVEQAGTIIIRWDLDGTVRFMNEYGLEFFGYSEEEMIGQNVMIIFPERDSDGEKLTGLSDAIIANPEGYWVNENENIAKDGSRYWMSWSNRALFDESGQMTGIMAIGVDRTAEKQAEEMLRASRQELRDLTAELAMTEQRERREIAVALHDNLGQTLAFSKMRLSAAKASGKVEDGTADDVLQFLDDAIGFVRSLTEQLASPILSQMGLVTALSSLTEEIAERHGMPVSVYCDNDPGRMDEVVETTLFQATRELLHNAIKHAEPGQVNVRCTLKDQMVEIEVEDDGRGFDPSQLERRTVPRTGGFGLMNVNERISYLGGRVEIKSQRGEGTTIRLLSPLTDREKTEV